MDPTWQIVPDPISSDVYASRGYTVPETGRSLTTTDLFGRGILRPFRRDKNNDFQSGTGAMLIRAAVGLVLGTICQSLTTQGELPWRTEFGSLTELLRLRNKDASLRGIARHYVVDAVERWVPVVKITSSEFVNGGRNTLYLKVTYDVIDPVGRRVLVPGLQTAVPIG